MANPLPHQEVDVDQRTCPVCARPVIGRSDKIYCSTACSVAGYRRRNADVYAERNRERMARRRLVRRSRRMRTARAKVARAARGRGPSKIWQAGLCPICRTPTIWDNPRHMTCSEPCRIAHRERRRSERRRIRRLEIFERDQWRCWLCGDGIDRELQVPHRMAATVDHVQPRIFGGSDDPSNLRAAHHSCNSRRGCAPA